MSSSKGVRKSILTAALVALCLLASACWESRSRNTVVAGGRFHVVAAAASDLGAQLLVDSATGDLWKLEQGNDGSAWVLLARGPEDHRDLDADILFGPDESE
jgi:hypothetical protein